jgi:hypothetical protein
MAFPSKLLLVVAMVSLLAVGFTGQLPLASADDPLPGESGGPVLLANAGLDQVNLYRSIAGLPPVIENTTWSNGDYLHSRYMVKNNIIAHSEN